MQNTASQKKTYYLLKQFIFHPRGFRPANLHFKFIFLCRRGILLFNISSITVLFLSWTFCWYKMLRTRVKCWTRPRRTTSVILSCTGREMVVVQRWWVSCKGTASSLLTNSGGKVAGLGKGLWEQLGRDKGVGLGLGWLREWERAAGEKDKPLSEKGAQEKWTAAAATGIPGNSSWEKTDLKRDLQELSQEQLSSCRKGSWGSSHCR